MESGPPDFFNSPVKQRRVMAISIYPYLTGAPHRIKSRDALRHILARDGAVMWTGSEILDSYRGQVAEGAATA